MMYTWYIIEVIPQSFLYTPGWLEIPTSPSIIRLCWFVYHVCLRVCQNITARWGETPTVKPKLETPYTSKQENYTHKKKEEKLNT